MKKQCIIDSYFVPIPTLRMDNSGIEQILAEILERPIIDLIMLGVILVLQRLELEASIFVNFQCCNNAYSKS